MAFLHCHNCDWEQDDFWEWRIKWTELHKWRYRPFGYNPLSLILEDIAENIWPRRQHYDQWFADEVGWKTNRPHSWFVMMWGIKKHFKRLFTQTWWTERAFKKDYNAGVAKCPNCGKADEFDID